MTKGISLEYYSPGDMAEFRFTPAKQKISETLSNNNKTATIVDKNFREYILEGFFVKDNKGSINWKKSIVSLMNVHDLGTQKLLFFVSDFSLSSKKLNKFMNGSKNYQNFQFMMNKNDTIYGNPQKNRQQLRGYEGNDKIYTYSKNTSLNGGNGEDKLYGSRDGSYFKGGIGNDLLQGISIKKRVDTFELSRGDDTIDGFDKSDIIDLASEFFSETYELTSVGNNVLIDFGSDDSSATTLVKNAKISHVEEAIHFI